MRYAARPGVFLAAAPRPSANRSAVAAPEVSSAAGFSLLELLVVLAILVSVASLALSYARTDNDGRALRRSAHLVAASLREARLAALEAGTPVAVTLEGAGGLARRLPERTRMVSAADGIVFLADGRSTGGELRLHRGDFAVTLAVDWFTGAVTVGEVR